MIISCCLICLYLFIFLCMPSPRLIGAAPWRSPLAQPSALLAQPSASLAQPSDSLAQPSVSLAQPSVSLAQPTGAALCFF